MISIQPARIEDILRIYKQMLLAKEGDAVAISDNEETRIFILTSITH